MRSAARRFSDSVVRAVGVLRGRPSYQDRCRDLIARHAPGHSFVDVGAMWNVHGAYSFHALASGATCVTASDVMEQTPEFSERNRSTGDAISFVRGDINEATTMHAIGPHDVVFCSGVLYHMPHPLLTLERLRSICRETLILGSATIPEQSLPQMAMFYPYLPPPTRLKIGYLTPDAKIGLDGPFDPAVGTANWYWGFSPTCVEAMLQAAGFHVAEVFHYRRAICVVASL